MPVSVDTFWMPKSGHTADEYEDAFAASRAHDFPFRAAVSDGATESAFSGGWARTLAAEYVKEGGLVETCARARTLFSPARDARWYVQAKAAQGAHAALLGLELHPGSWRAESVGDCCLLLVRDGTLRRSWPFTEASDFHHRPHLVSSRTPLAAGDVASDSGTWQAGDAFVLATDALAAWLLDGGLEPFLRSSDFEALVASARDRGRAGPPEAGRSARERSAAKDPDRAHEDDLPALRNDDVTAMLIHPTP